MAEGLQIGQLPQKENLTGNELIPFQQGSSNGSMSTAALKKYIGTGGGTGGSTDYMNYITEYNVSVQHPTSGIDGSNKYSLEGAIAQVPQELRNIGLKVSFINSDGKVETWEFQGGTFTNIGSWIQQVRRTDLSDIRNNIVEIQHSIYSGIVESGRCGGFDIASKSILEGENRFYKKISLLDSKKLTVDLSNNSYKVIVFQKDNDFAFYVSCEDNVTLNLEPIIQLTGANIAYIISQNELSDDKIILDGKIVKHSVNEILSGNLWNEEYVIGKGEPISGNKILGLQMVSSYGDIALISVNRNSTIYHKHYLVWKLYNDKGDFVTSGEGYSSTNIETGDSDFMLVARPARALYGEPIISYDANLTKSPTIVPYYVTDILTQLLTPSIYKALSNTALIDELKKYVYDKYVDKSVFFVGDSYAAGVNALEFNGYPNDFAYRHPLADAQFGGSYVWSGRTISTFTSDNILKSVLNICTDFGYQRIPETVNFEDVSDLIYSVKSILFEDVTEMDRVIYNSKGGSVIIYSVNKDNYNKTQLVRFNTQPNVIEYTFRHKISALEGECIGIEFTIGLAYKSNTSASFKTMDGNVIQGEAKVQVCLNRCHYLIMEGGLNDMYQRGDNPGTHVPFGELLSSDDYTTDKFDDKTFCGALEHMVREAVFKLPATKLGFLIMPQPGDSLWNDRYAKAIRDVCDKYGVPYLNLGNLKRMNIVSGKSEASRLFWCTNTNGTFNYHPSAIGYNTMMNDAIMKFIDSL